MKKNSSNPFRLACLLSMVLALLTAPKLSAQTPVTQGHVDVGIAFEDNAWDLHVHDEVNDVEYSPPSGALLVVKPGAQTVIPNGTAWAFLGNSGQPVWILPKVQDPNLLFLGFGAEEIPDGLFVGNQLTMALKSVTGPGGLAIYDFDSFGDSEVWMNSRDGINGADARIIPTGAHSHVNWAFTEPGEYTVVFEASGTLVDGNQFTTSGNVPYSFQVQAVPEPGTAVLLGVGALALCFFRRR